MVKLILILALLLPAPCQAAMDGDALGTAIAAAINGLSAAQKEDLPTVWKTIAGVIVSHIQTNAVIVNGQVNGVTGVGPPGGPLPIVNQPVTGGVN